MENANPLAFLLVFAYREREFSETRVPSAMKGLQAWKGELHPNGLQKRQVRRLAGWSSETEKIQENKPYFLQHRKAS